MSNRRKKVDLCNLDGDVVKTFDSVSDAAKEFDVTHCAILYWIGTNNPKNGFTFKFHNEEDKSSSNYQYYKARPIKEKEVNREKYNVIKYEVINKRVSITPCPHRRYPRPMVGSAACMKCRYFRGRNRQSHEVACNRINK